MATQVHHTPRWWKEDYDSGWDRVKEAFRRDWEQTKHDLGGDAMDLDQDVDDTVGQAVGSRPIPPHNMPNFDDEEPAYRYGYGARQYYGTNYPEWNDELESHLRKDWPEDWDHSRAHIRRGYDYV